MNKTVQNCCTVDNQTYTTDGQSIAWITAIQNQHLCDIMQNYHESYKKGSSYKAWNTNTFFLLNLVFFVSMTILASESLSNLNGKVAVLTGASRGIGKAVADVLVDNGCKVVIGDILVEEGQKVVADYNAKAGTKVAAFIRTDVTKYSDNQALFKLADAEFGGVDYALLNAGIASNSNSMFTPMDDAVEERIIDINTTAVIKGTKVALLHMAKRGGGAIVHLASVAGFFSAP